MKKAEDVLGSNYTLAGGEKALAMDRSVNPNSGPPPSSSSSSFCAWPGPAMLIEDIVEPYTKTQKSKAKDILHGIQHIGRRRVNCTMLTAIASFKHWLNITHSQNKTNVPLPKGYATHKNAVSAYQKQQMEQSPPRDTASGIASAEVKRKSSIHNERVDVKKAGKKQKTEVDTDYTYDDDDTDSDSDSTETLVGEEEEEEEEEEDEEIAPQLN